MDLITKDDIEQSLINLGIDVISSTNSVVEFWFKGNKIQYYLKKQWATGKGIEDGRGWSHLFNQINNQEKCPCCGQPI